MERPMHKIEQYQKISADVWQLFKRYFPDDANLDDFTEQVHKLDLKYKSNPREYVFMHNLYKVYMQELHELKLQKERYENA